MPSTTVTIAIAGAVAAIAGAAKPIIELIANRRKRDAPLAIQGILSAKPRIALIDDEPGDLEQSRLTLNGDYEVSTYRKPFRALADIALECDRGEAFDLIIIDYMMEPMDGVEIVREIRTWQRKYRPEDRSRLVLFTRMGKMIDTPPGVMAVFRKPEDHLRLKEKVREVLNIAHPPAN